MDTQEKTRVSLGNFHKDTAKNLREALENRSYMDFEVTLGVQPGQSRHVTVYADTDESKGDVKNMIIRMLALEL